MTFITFQDGKVVLVDGKVGSGQACCCNVDCDCCPNPILFSEQVEVQPFPDFKATNRAVEVAGADWYVENATLKEDAPNRPCPRVAYRIFREAQWFTTGIYIRTEFRIRFFTVDCTQEVPVLIDVTSDYNEPEAPYPDGDTRIGDWTWTRGSFGAFPDESPTVGDLPEWPGDPFCGCPDVEGCNLVVVLDYPGAPLEYSNEPIGALGADCELSGEIADIPIESGGDISWNLTVGTDGNGDPVPQNITIVRTVDEPDNEQSCDDGITDCVPVLFSIECNPLP